MKTDKQIKAIYKI